MAKLTMLDGHPTDQATFEAHDAERHLPWASRTMPGVATGRMTVPICEEDA